MSTMTRPKLTSTCCAFTISLLLSSGLGCGSPGSGSDGELDDDGDGDEGQATGTGDTPVDTDSTTTITTTGADGSAGDVSTGLGSSEAGDDPEDGVENESVRTAKNVQVVISVLDNDTAPISGAPFVEVVSEPSLGTAEVLSGRNIRYAPALHANGTDSLVYRVLDDLGTVGVATVEIEILDETWVEIDGDMWSKQWVDLGDPPDPATELETQTTLIGVDAGGSMLAGVFRTPTGAQGVRIDDGARAVAPGPDGSQSALHHHREGFSAGARLLSESSLGLLWEEDSQNVQTFSVPDTTHTEAWSMLPSGRVVGRARGSLAFGDDEFHAIVVDPDNPSDWTPVGPESSESSIATDVDVSGRIAGSHITAAGERGFVQENGVASDVLPTDATSSRVWGLSDDGGLIVGSFVDAAGDRRGFVRADTDFPLDLPTAIASELFDAIDGVALVGTAVDPLGRQRGIQLSPVDLTTLGPVSSAQRAIEPKHPLIGHACGHTEIGPFDQRGAGASPTGELPAISATHTSYTMNLVETEEGFVGYFLLRTPSDGRYTLYVDEHVVLRPRELEYVSTVLRSTWCDRIDWVHQVEVPAGEHVFMIGPTHRSQANFVLEAGWAFD